MTISTTSQYLKPGVCTSSNRPANPFDGQVIYMTDVDQTAVWDGETWVVLAPIASGRNVVINGAMQVAQRGTSVASITTGGYHTADRWYSEPITIGTWTQSVENDAPTGSGFRKSLKMLCTTNDASPAAGDYFYVAQQRFEGQNLQQFLKGTSSAKQVTLSFWVKSNVTGTYIVEMYDGDNSRAVSASYSVSASATWEKKTITFPADTTGAYDNDNAASLYLNFWGGAGSTYSSGTLATTWVSPTTANRAVGQTNLAAATNNYWQITGVQLEAGAVATPFEFEEYGETLAKCQRYYFRQTADATAVYSHFGIGRADGTTSGIGQTVMPVVMRVTPTAIESSNIAITDGAAVYAITSSSIATNQCNNYFIAYNFGMASGGTQFRVYYIVSNNNSAGFLAFSAEL